MNKDIVDEQFISVGGDEDENMEENVEE